MRVLLVGLPAAIAADISRYLTAVRPQAAVAIMERLPAPEHLRTLDAVIALATPDHKAALEPLDLPSLSLIWMVRPPRTVATPRGWPQVKLCPLPLRLAQLAALLPGSGAITDLAPGWRLDGSRAQLAGPDREPLILTEKEAALLQALHEASPLPLAREALLAQVWGYGEQVDTHTLETHIYRLRQKLADSAPLDIRTVENGYALALKNESGAL